MDLNWLTRRRRLTRRGFLLGAGGAIGAGAAGALYTRYGEPHWLEVDRNVVRIAPAGETPPPVKLVHLSDLHSSPDVPLDYIADAVALAVRQKPDAFVLTGDFITVFLNEADRYAAILAQLSAAAPAVACLGNHDGGVWMGRIGGPSTPDGVLELLKTAGIRCLQNTSHPLTLRGRAFQFIGVGDYWSQECKPWIAFQRTPPRAGATRVLLNHNPDAKDILRSFDWDLMLCGHTHGGQLRLPLIGTPFAPVVDKRYVSGLHRWNERWLYITHGVGNLHGVRFNCRPQVSVLEIL